MTLYKYVSEDRYSILKDGLIRFTQPQAFNDPFEMKPFISSISNSDYITKSFEEGLRKAMKERYDNLPIEQKKLVPFDTILKQGMTLAKESNLLDLANQQIQELTPKIRKTTHDVFENHIGILSLTESDSNLLMWAHYANMHQGFVIEFDSSHKFFDQRKTQKDELRHLIKVNYNAKRPKIDLTTNGSIEAFTVKSKEWEYEREWRMILMLQDSNKIIKSNPYDIHLFKIPLSAIKSVTLGARATIKTSEKIMNLISSNSELKQVSIFRMNIHESNFTLIKNKEKNQY